MDTFLFSNLKEVSPLTNLERLQLETKGITLTPSELDIYTYNKMVLLLILIMIPPVTQIKGIY